MAELQRGEKTLLLLFELSCSISQNRCPSAQTAEEGTPRCVLKMGHLPEESTAESRLSQLKVARYKIASLLLGEHRTRVSRCVPNLSKKSITYCQYYMSNPRRLLWKPRIKTCSVLYTNTDSTQCAGFIHTKQQSRKPLRINRVCMRSDFNCSFNSSQLLELPAYYQSWEAAWKQYFNLSSGTWSLLMKLSKSHPCT